MKRQEIHKEGRGIVIMGVPRYLSVLLILVFVCTVGYLCYLIRVAPRLDIWALVLRIFFAIIIAVYVVLCPSYIITIPFTIQLK